MNMFYVEPTSWCHKLKVTFYYSPVGVFIQVGLPNHHHHQPPDGWLLLPAADPLPAQSIVRTVSRFRTNKTGEDNFWTILLTPQLNPPWKCQTKNLNHQTWSKSDNFLVECCAAGFLRLIFVFHVIAWRAESPFYADQSMSSNMQNGLKFQSFNLYLPWIILRCKNITNYQRSTYCDEMKTCSLVQPRTRLINCALKCRRDRLFNFVQDPGPTNF